MAYGLWPSMVPRIFARQYKISPCLLSWRRPKEGDHYNFERVHHVVSSASFSTSSSLWSNKQNNNGHACEYAQLKREASALVERASVKVRGSTQYAKLRRRHVAVVCDAIRVGLQMLHNNNNNGPYNSYSSHVVGEATKQLTANLGGMGADRGIMPDFSDPRALRGYALGHFGRVRLLSELVAQPEPDWLTQTVSQLLVYSDRPSSPGSIIRPKDNPHGTNERQIITLASLGGGCGYDFVALAALSEFLQGPTIRATVYDYEPAWNTVLADVERVTCDVLTNNSHNNNTLCRNTIPRTTNTRPFAHTCAFESCDITSPLEAPSNEALAAVVGSTQIFSCSYVVAENAMKLRTNQFEFFRQLFAEASDGSLFLFTETTHRLWPELIDLALNTSNNSNTSSNDHPNTSFILQIAIPHIRSGKSGCQLAFRKDCGSRRYGKHGLDEHQQTLYKQFQSDNGAHLSRLDRGWKRDQRKVRGAKHPSSKGET